MTNNIAFSKNVNRQYDSSFANSGITVSGKAGPSLRVRKPNRYTVTSGAALNVQDNTETYVTVSCSTQQHIGMKFTSQDLTLTIDDFAGRYLKPAGIALANKMDLDGMALYNTVWNNVGTPGVTPASALVFLNAGAKLDNNAAPRDNERAVVIDPNAQASTVNALTGLFQKSELIAEQYEAGQMGTGLGFNFSMSQNVNSHTVGSRNNANDATVASYTASTISLTAADPSGAIYRAGDTFSISGITSVNPVSHVSTGHIAQFVVTADTTASGTTVTLPVAPAVVISGATQTISGDPTTHLVDFANDGTASTVYPQNMAFHKDAFTLVTADMVLPDGVDFRAREVYDGISVRVVRQYNINGDELPARCDILYGWKELYPEWACRIPG